MVKREAKKIYPTMKIEADDENELDLAFKECQATIISVQDVKTNKYGDKVSITLENSEIGRFNIFVNNFSMENLIKAYGDDDKNWTGKIVDLKQESNEAFNNDMIVVYPVAN